MDYWNPIKTNTIWFRADFSDHPIIHPLTYVEGCDVFLLMAV